MVKGAGGAVVFENEDQGFSFPFLLNPEDGDGGLGDLKTLRVAFPKYIARRPFYKSAHIKTQLGKFELEEAQNINDIAFKTLEDRMLREFANSLLRLALKKAAEAAVRAESEGLGAVDADATRAELGGQMAEDADLEVAAVCRVALTTGPANELVPPLRREGEVDLVLDPFGLA